MGIVNSELTSDEIARRQVRGPLGLAAHRSWHHEYPGPGKWNAASCAAADHDRCSIPDPAAERLSKLLWDARENLEILADVVERRSGRPDTFTRGLVRQIDEYRAEQGWNPNGFGGES